MLTERELQVARLLSDGLSRRVIGRELGITESTVRAHIDRIAVKIRARGRKSHAIISYYSRRHLSRK